MRYTRYEFSSVHVEPPRDLSAEIVTWGRENVSDDDIFVSQIEPTFGREDEIHATALYGIHTNDPDQIKSLLGNIPKIRVTLGRLNVFPSSKFDVLVIDISSSGLHDLNKLLKNLDHTELYGEYKPHLTIAYTKRGRAWKFMRMSIWKGRSFLCDHIVFSSKDAIKYRITLQ